MSCTHDERDPYGCVRCDDGARIQAAELEASRWAAQAYAGLEHTPSICPELPCTHSTPEVDA